jgi:hypothetical protein
MVAVLKIVELIKLGEADNWMHSRFATTRSEGGELHSKARFGKWGRRCGSAQAWKPPRLGRVNAERTSQRR